MPTPRKAPYRRNLTEKAFKCDWCGTTFVPKRYVDVPGIKRGCSQSCRGKLVGKRKLHWTEKKQSPDRNGYLIVSSQGTGRSSLVHRLIMEDALGRPLEKWEQVHHRNGVKADNRLENLEIVLLWHHQGEITCPNCQVTFAVK